MDEWKNSISPTDEKTQENSLYQRGETPERKHRLLKEGIGQPMLLIFCHEEEGNEKTKLTITGGELLPCHDTKRIVGGIKSPPLKNKGDCWRASHICDSEGRK